MHIDYVMVEGYTIILGVWASAQIQVPWPSKELLMNATTSPTSLKGTRQPNVRGIAFIRGSAGKSKIHGRISSSSRALDRIWI